MQKIKINGRVFTLSWDELMSVFSKISDDADIEFIMG